MRIAVAHLSLLAALGLAACANNPNRPTDVGNMQYPAPVSAGNVAVERPSVQNGSAQQQTPYGGVLTRESTTPDTGNMALPPRAQGNSTPRSY